jgi:hypothetical protein
LIDQGYINRGLVIIALDMIGEKEKPYACTGAHLGYR